jgi:hypothetical protein
MDYNGVWAHMYISIVRMPRETPAILHNNSTAASSRRHHTLAPSHGFSLGKKKEASSSSSSSSSWPFFCLCRCSVLHVRAPGRSIARASSPDQEPAVQAKNPSAETAPTPTTTSTTTEWKERERERGPPNTTTLHTSRLNSNRENVFREREREDHVRLIRHEEASSLTNQILYHSF